MTKHTTAWQHFDLARQPALPLACSECLEQQCASSGAPLLLETSTQAQTVKPLVISVVFGLFSATVLVLLVLPAFYAILDDLRSPGRSQET
jgi:hypothetical protein